MDARTEAIENPMVSGIFDTRSMPLDQLADAGRAVENLRRAQSDAGTRRVAVAAFGASL